MQEKDNEIIINLKEPRLSSLEKLYVKTYQLTLSHPKAFKALRPDLKSHPTSSNPFFKSDAVQYHINKNIILRMEALDLSENKVLDLLLQEATRLGSGSSPTARVQALTLLGKHVGLFEEKKDDTEGVTFNIVNYNTPSSSTTEKEEILAIEEVTKLPDNIKLESFDGIENKE